MKRSEAIKLLAEDAENRQIDGNDTDDSDWETVSDFENMSEEGLTAELIARDIVVEGEATVVPD